MTTSTDAGLATALVRLSHLVHYVVTEVGRHHELTPQQTHLLCMLKGGPVSMAELGRSLHLEKSSLTGLVDRVERRGLVTRLRDTPDRRALRVGLTDQGLQLATRSHREVIAGLEGLIHQLPSADRDRLILVIEQIVVQHATVTGCATPRSALSSGGRASSGGAVVAGRDVFGSDAHADESACEMAKRRHVSEQA